MSGRIHDLMERATGLEGEEAERRVSILRNLSDEVNSTDGAEMILSLAERVRVLTDPKSMVCETINTRVGPRDSCSDHVDWIPQVSCPSGKFMHSIDVYADRRGGGWGCGFEVECCSLGVSPEAVAPEGVDQSR